jgi:hypothetical protein
LIRGILIVLGSLVGFVVALVLIAGIGLYLALKPSRDEVVRVMSPNGRATATVTEINGGATTSFAYDIEVFSTHRAFLHRQVASFYGATRSPVAYGVDLRWKSDSVLDVEYWNARNAKLSIENLTISGTNIRVVLKPSTLNPTAPEGGMLYNREHGRGES